MAQGPHRTVAQYATLFPIVQCERAHQTSIHEEISGFLPPMIRVWSCAPVCLVAGSAMGAAVFANDVSARHL